MKFILKKVRNERNKQLNSKMLYTLCIQAIGFFDGGRHQQSFVTRGERVPVHTARCIQLSIIRYTG